MRIICILILVISFPALASEPPGAIYVNLQKLASLKRVLYVAAHPDDENTRALAWFSLGEMAETAYFSLTRGDGGENLIGDELGDELGVLRTQELLAARSHDRAKQYFSRAVDFGYSKSAQESFEKWGKEEILSDLVLMIRTFRPHVIVTRFPPDERGGHGHHTASAMLALDAFDLAADSSYMSRTAKKYGTWQTTSVYWNTSTWWTEGLADSVRNSPDFLSFDIGGYSPELGMSYNEIGTIARSQHKCQGFGAVIERGSRIEYFKHLKGKKLENHFFEEVDESWTSILDEDFERSLANQLTGFDFALPEANVPGLLHILERLRGLPESEFRNEKIERCTQIIADCMGLHVELLGDDYAFQAGEYSNVVLSALNRSSIPVTLTECEFALGNKPVNEELTTDQPFTLEYETEMLFAAGFGPYWLREPHDGNVYTVEDEAFLLEPGNLFPFGIVRFGIHEVSLDLKVPIVYKWRDPAYGERQRVMTMTPPVALVKEDQIIMAKPGERKTIRHTVHCFRDSLRKTLKLIVPEGWNASQTEFTLEFTKRHEEHSIEFDIWPSQGAKSGTLRFEHERQWREITYDHIPTQMIMPPADFNCIVLNVEINPGKIAYINGVEDGIPEAIERMGFEVDRFDVAELSSADLSSYQSVVLGIRIYNVHPELKNFNENLYDYVEQGGNVIMQYNTASRSLRNQTFGPVPFELSRNRVTEEDAEVTFLEPKHPILNTPNRLSSKDFDNWVQERGLYFANNWEDAYTPLFSWSDTGEAPQNGALIVTQYGKGQFVYTGISFFRELPKGVEGAYRLFANLLSYQP